MEALKRTYFGWKGKMSFLRLVKNPNDTHSIIRMSDSLKKAAPPEVIERQMERVYADPRLEEAYASRYWPVMPPFAELQAMPAGSFGNELARFLATWNLDKDLFPGPSFASKADYLRSRVFQSHDAWHVLTGYNPVLEDELALQAFSVGQYHLPTSVMIVSGGFLHLLSTDPERAPGAMAAVSEGYARGKLAKSLLAEPVLERLADPLEDVRRDLGIEART